MRDPRVQRAHQPDLRPDPLDDPRFDPPTDFEVDFFAEYGLSWAGEGVASGSRLHAKDRSPVPAMGCLPAGGPPLDAPSPADGSPGLETAA